MASITNKQDMYNLLAAGKLGNTVPMWFDIQRWIYDNYPDGWYGESLQWGVRTLTPGGPCRLFCPDSEVIATATGLAESGHRVNISPMIETVRNLNVTLMANVWDSPTGLVVEGAEWPTPGTHWRERMQQPDRYEGIRARHVIARHLVQSSTEELFDLLAEYPGHVVELSATNRPYGTVPGRNAVIWEVRSY